MKGTTLKGDDSMAEVLHVMDHDDILFFTKDGSARNLKAYQVPEASRTAAGSAITQVGTCTHRRLPCVAAPRVIGQCNASQLHSLL